MRKGSKTIKNRKSAKKAVPTKALTRKQEYHLYLKSPEWIKKREKFKEMYGNKCIVCDSKESLHIHHLNYDCIDNETINDVACLCKGHHLDVHRKRLIIWMFTKPEMEHFKAIIDIICSDESITYLALIKKDLK